MPVRLAKFKSVETNRNFEPWPVKEPVEFTIFNITTEKAGTGAKHPGEPYLKFEFQVLDGKRKAWRNFSLVPDALSFLKRLLVELDVYVEEDQDEEDFEFEPADLLGRHVLLTFGPEKQYNGNMTQEVVKVEAAD